jgi:ribosome biogenesis protein BRX1
VTPAATRASIKREIGQKYRQRKEHEEEREERAKRRKEDLGEDELAVDKVFA